MNGYFQLVHETAATYVRIFCPTQGGSPITINAIGDYLKMKNITFDVVDLNRRLMLVKEDGEKILVNQVPTRPERECYRECMSEDKMTYTLHFYPPSEGAERMSYHELMQDFEHKGIRFGLLEDVVQEFVRNPEYCTDIVVAKGKPVRQGREGYIEYLFQTDGSVRPTIREDGSVDFFQLNLVSHCMEGDKLAILHPSDFGEEGMAVTGEVIKPIHVNPVKLRGGKNVQMSEDQMTLFAQLAGHVELDNDVVCVSDVLQVTDVDPSTGNLEYDGSIVITGNVIAGYTVKAKGHIEVRGVVEGSVLEAGGNITIARGMNGMGRGVLRAGQNIVVKYLENVTAQAEGDVTAESILHSNVSAGNMIEVTGTGRRGFITGGKATAAALIKVKALGSEMGATTVVEVGVDPTIKRRIAELENSKAEILKVLKTTGPVVQALVAKIKQGIKVTPEQVEQGKKLMALDQVKKAELQAVEAEWKELTNRVGDEVRASVVVQDAVYPGTQIVVSGASLNVGEAIKYCRFIYEQGEVRVTGL